MNSYLRRKTLTLLLLLGGLFASSLSVIAPAASAQAHEFVAESNCEDGRIAGSYTIDNSSNSISITWERTQINDIASISLDLDGTQLIDYPKQKLYATESFNILPNLSGIATWKIRRISSPACIFITQMTAIDGVKAEILMLDTVNASPEEITGYQNLPAGISSTLGECPLFNVKFDYSIDPIREDLTIAWQASADEVQEVNVYLNGNQGARQYGIQNGVRVFELHGVLRGHIEWEFTDYDGVDCGAEATIGLPETSTIKPNRNPELCKLRSDGYSISAGFPHVEPAINPHGRYKVAVAFIDFNDYVGDDPTDGFAYTPRVEGEEQLRKAEAYLEAASYGKLDVEFVPYYDNWIRMPGSAHNFYRNGLSYIDIVEALDTHINFAAGIDSVLAVLPSYWADSGSATNSSLRPALSNVIVDGVRITNFANVNNKLYSANIPSVQRPQPTWWFSAAHELAHNLGLPDLYYLEALPRVIDIDIPEGKAWQVLEFGLMRAQSQILYNFENEILNNPASSYSHLTLEDISNDTISIGGIRASEMLGWSRWQLGWLSERNNVECVAERYVDEEISLYPIASLNNTRPDGVASIIIPLPDFTDGGKEGQKGLVIESRRNIGYDSFKNYSTTFLCEEGCIENEENGRVDFEESFFDHEGLLVYEVRSNRTSGYLPINILPQDTSDCLGYVPPSTCRLNLDDYPIVGLGDEIRYDVGDGTEIIISLTYDNGVNQHVAHVIRKDKV